MPSRCWFKRYFQTYAERRKSSNSRNMCYAGIRLLESPWWADKISLWRNTTCSNASEELQQQQSQQKTSAGEWFHRRGWRWHWLYPVAGGSLSVKTVVAMPNIITLLNSHLYYCIPTKYFHQYQPRKPRTPATNPSGGMFDVITHKHTFLGAWTTHSTSLMRPQESDGISCVMERFAYVETGFIPEKHIKHNKGSANKVIPCKNLI